MNKNNFWFLKLNLKINWFLRDPGLVQNELKLLIQSFWQWKLFWNVIKMKFSVRRIRTRDFVTDFISIKDKFNNSQKIVKVPDLAHVYFLKYFPNAPPIIRVLLKGAFSPSPSYFYSWPFHSKWPDRGLN